MTVLDLKKGDTRKLAKIRNAQTVTYEMMMSVLLKRRENAASGKMHKKDQGVAVVNSK